MIRTVKSDYEIKIGIKDGEVVSLDWGEIICHEPSITAREINSHILKYFNQAKQMLLRKGPK